MAEPIKALTLYAAWAHAICVLGKRVENRPERFARVIANQVQGGWLAIHAGANIGARKGLPGTLEVLDNLALMAGQTADWQAWPLRSWSSPDGKVQQPAAQLQRGTEQHLLLPSEIATSAVVAVCRVRGVLPPGLVHPWKVTDGAALKLDDVRVLSKPVPCKGAQGLWRLPEDVLAAIEAQGVLHG